MNLSIEEIRRQAVQYQRMADERRIEETNRTVDAWTVGLALLASLAITSFVLVAVGLLV